MAFTELEKSRTVAKYIRTEFVTTKLWVQMGCKKQRLRATPSYIGTICL